MSDDRSQPNADRRRSSLQGAAPPVEWARTILDSIADGVFTVDADFRITYFNKAAERITGVPAREALGKPCCEVFRASICEAACALRHTMETGKPVVEQAVAILNAENREVPISISTALLKDPAGRTVGGVETFRDLTDVETLRREIEKSTASGISCRRRPPCSGFSPSCRKSLRAKARS